MESFHLACLHLCASLTDADWAAINRSADKSDSPNETWLRYIDIPSERRSKIWSEFIAIDQEAVRETVSRLSVQLVRLHDVNYPHLLRESVSPPPLLYIRGLIADAARGGMAVVGSRGASSYGIWATKHLVAPLAQARIPIISGMAYGIDAAAHETAITSGGPTVAVFGCGIDVIYPREHELLADHILESGGCIISESPLGAQPERWRFPRRNRIIAGLAHGVVLVEAADRSGALVTAKFAVEANRDVYVVPGPINSPLSVGPNSWLKLGATPLLAADQILQQYGAGTVAEKVFTAQNPTEEKIINVLVDGPRHIDDISESCTLDASVAAATLSRLEIQGTVVQVGPLTYSLSP